MTNEKINKCIELGSEIVARLQDRYDEDGFRAISPLSITFSELLYQLDLAKLECAFLAYELPYFLGPLKHYEIESSTKQFILREQELLQTSIARMFKLSYIDPFDQNGHCSNAIWWHELTGETLDTQGPEGSGKMRITRQMFEPSKEHQSTCIAVVKSWIRYVQGRVAEPVVDTAQRSFGMADLRSITGLKNDAIRNYGKPKLGSWPSRGQGGKQFTMNQAQIIVKAIETGSSEKAIVENCRKWLEQHPV